jgi:hypothetical protein
MDDDEMTDDELKDFLSEEEYEYIKALEREDEFRRVQAIAIASLPPGGSVLGLFSDGSDDYTLVSWITEVEGEA